MYQNYINDKWCVSEEKREKWWPIPIRRAFIYLVISLHYAYFHFAIDSIFSISDFSASPRLCVSAERTHFWLGWERILMADGAGEDEPRRPRPRDKKVYIVVEVVVWLIVWFLARRIFLSKKPGGGVGMWGLWGVKGSCSCFAAYFRSYLHRTYS